MQVKLGCHFRCRLSTLAACVPGADDGTYYRLWLRAAGITACAGCFWFVTLCALLHVQDAGLGQRPCVGMMLVAVF